MFGEAKVYEFESFHLDVENKQLLKEGSSIALNHKAFTILLILVRNFGHLTKKEDIIEEVWSDHFVEESNLTQHIYTLRKVLGSNSKNESFIKTYPKVGYLFNADVTPIYQPEKNSINGNGGKDNFSPDANQENLFTYTPIVLNNEGERVARENRRGNQFFDYKTVVFLAALLLTTVIVAGVLYWRALSTPDVAENKIKSIAVLPFKPIVDSEEDKKLGLGMADAVITKLGKLQQIPVRPTSAVFPYVSQPTVDPISAGQSLDVDTILEGTVQRDGGKIRVTVRLISVNDDKALWGESFNEDFQDVFAMQDVISEKVARSLTNNLTSTQKLLLEQHATNNPAAYQAYLMGIYFWNTRTKEGLTKATESFKQAIEIDPKYAYAYAGLADAYTMLAYYHYDNSGEKHIPAKEAAIKAIELDPTIPEAYIALALVKKTFDHDESGSRMMLEKALKLAPYNATAHQRYAWQLVAENQMDEAVAEMRLAHKYSPLSPIINIAMCEILNYDRKYEEAREFCKRAEDLAPDSPVNAYAIADNFFFSGQPEMAIGKLEEKLQKNNKDRVAMVRLAYFYAKTGKTAESSEIYEKLKQMEWKNSRKFMGLAVLSYALGKKEDSYGFLRQAADNCAVPFYADYEPYFDELRTDEQGKKFLASRCKSPLN